MSAEPLIFRLLKAFQTLFVVALQLGFFFFLARECLRYADAATSPLLRLLLLMMQLTEDVLRSFGQALKDSVQRGELRLDLSSEDGAPPVTITPSAQGIPSSTSTSTPVGAGAGAGAAAGEGQTPTGPSQR